MNQEFKDSLINDIKSSTPLQRRAFLRMLKFEPDTVLKIISANIMHWAMDFVMKTGKMLYGYDVKADNQADSQELLKAYQEHFAKELESVTR